MKYQAFESTRCSGSVNSIFLPEDMTTTGKSDDMIGMVN